jgi:predicted ArsR family transcriptional regulator
MQIYICIIPEYDYNMTVDTMEITSRQKVFEVIRKHQVITISELNLFLDMTSANIRHHVSVLKADGLVERIDSRKKMGRGRPEAVYAVSNVFNEDGLETLIEGILDLWFSSVSPDELSRKMQAIARYLAGESADDNKEPVNKRLASCMTHLNILHYKAHWEASPSGPRIKFGNCPYRKIVDRHPEICLMDKYLVEKLVGIKISQVSKLERDQRGILYCSFIGH